MVCDKCKQVIPEGSQICPECHKPVGGSDDDPGIEKIHAHDLRAAKEAALREETRRLEEEMDRQAKAALEREKAEKSHSGLEWG